MCKNQNERTFCSVQVSGRAEGVGVPPRRGALQVVSRQTKPLRRQVEARKVEVPDLGKGKSSLHGRLRGGQHRLGFGRFAITVQQVLNEEGRVLGRSARLLRRLGHRCARGLNADDHGREAFETKNQSQICVGGCRYPVCHRSPFDSSREVLLKESR